MNIIVANRFLSYSFLYKNHYLFKIPSISSQIRLSSTSNSKIKTAEITSLESETISTNDSQKFSFITDSPITQTCEDLLTSMHDFFSLEWSSTIFLTAVLFRLSICFPIKIYQEHLMAKLVNLQPKINETLENNFKNFKRDSVFLSPEIKRKIARQVNLVLKN